MDNDDATAAGDTAEQTEGRRTGRHLSQILAAIAADESRLRISVGDLFHALGARAFGALMLIFALPNVVPTPPGTSALLGTPLVFLAAQLMLGYSPWLPQFIAKRSMTREDFAAIVRRIAPRMARAERMLRPRLTVLVYPPAEYLVGFACFCLAVILALPIPLGNILPALAICLFSFGILERDGLCTIIGWLLSIVSVVVVAGVLYALFKVLVLLVSTAFA